MDFALTDEQRWLAESVDGLLGREGDPWTALVDFGVLEVGDADEALGAVELALVGRKVGERLAAVPLVGTAALRYVAGRDVLDAAGQTVAVCLSEPGRRFAPSSPGTVLQGDRVFGQKSAAPFAERAEVLAVSASGDDRAAIALVPADGAGVEISAEPILDPTLRAGRVELDGALTTRVLPEATASPERLAAVAAVLAAAEGVGAAAAVLALARDYASERRQFGKTIGSFQAVRHLLADMVVKVESSWSSVLYAAASLDEHAPDDLRSASVAKAWASRATLDVAHGALQVFGGIAFTAEHAAHRFLRRIASLGGQYGTAEDHEDSLGRALARELEVLT